MTAGWFPDPSHGAQLRYFDGREWTGHVQPTAVGMPLGESVVVLRPIARPADIDVACAVNDVHGRQIGSISSRGRKPSNIGRESEDLDFVVVAPNGAVRLLITRIGGIAKNHRVEVRDPAGLVVGRLVQTSSYWRQFRTPRLTMALESRGRRLATTDVCIEPAKKRFAEVSSPIHDGEGREVASVRRSWHYADTISDFFDYRLTCHHPVLHPLPELLVATAFSHYLYDRLAVGGPLSTYNRFGRGGTWSDPR